MSRAQDIKIQPQWWSKSLIGSLLGLLMAYLMVALFAWFGPGGIDAPAKVQLNMWLVTPIWLTILSLSYLARTWQRLLLTLGGVNLGLLSLFLILKVSL